MTPGVLVAAIIAIPALVALVVALLPPRIAGRVALLAPLAVVALGWQAWVGYADAPLVIPLPWLTDLGIGADLRLDRLGLFFVLLVGGIGLAVVQYSRWYVAASEARGYWPLLLGFMSAMLGLALSDSLVLFFLFWEGTTLASALLIALHPQDAEARRGAVRAFIVTGAGGLCLLAGATLLALRAGSWSLSVLAERADTIVADPLHIPALLLLLLGAFAKSAQVPFHAWLPGAMAAPAPVSAYLHSATMVKAGILLLGRLFPIFENSPIWLPTLLAVGLTTYLIGAWNALRSHDLKQLLAHSTVSNLGMLTAMYGIFAKVGVAGELIGIANHALYKSALFLLVGWLEKATGTRDFSLLDRENWIRHERIGGALIGIGALAMAGTPLLLGFVGKEKFLASMVTVGGTGGVVVVAAACLGGAITVATSLKLFVGTFWGPEPAALDRAHYRLHISRWLLVVPAVLLVPQMMGGIAPASLVRWIAGDAVAWPGGPAWWHHADLLLALGLGIFAAGALGFMLRTWIDRLPRLGSLQVAYDRLGELVLQACHALGGAMQAGGHPRHLAIVLLAALALAAPALVQADWSSALRWPGIDVSWVPAGLIVVGAAGALAARDRLGALVLVAVAGYGVALFDVVLLAPDLALTQVLVETISLVLLLLVFRRLPALKRERPAVARAVVSLAVGVGFVALALASGGIDAPDPAGARLAAASVPEAHGHNAVNVILVDFRGLDTLGEAAVLATAALAVLALMRRGGRCVP